MDDDCSCVSYVSARWTGSPRVYVFHAVTHERILVRKNCWKYGREVGSSQCKNRYTVYFLDKKERELFGVRLLESLLIVVRGGCFGWLFHE